MRKFLDLLFPPSRRRQEVRDLAVSDIDRLPQNRRPEPDFIRAICDYRNERIRQIVKAAKYDYSPRAIRLMAEVMAEELLTICSEYRVFDEKIVITSVPLTRRHYRARGHDHGKRLALAIVEHDQTDSFEYRPLLKKIKETPTQTSLEKVARHSNLVGAFRATEEAAHVMDVIVVVDDVTTTGATLKEAYRALREKTNAQVIAVAFAH